MFIIQLIELIMQEHRSSRETAPLHPRASGNKRDQLTLKNAVADDEEQKSGNR